MNLFADEKIDVAENDFIYKYLDSIWEQTLNGKTTTTYFNATKQEFDEIISYYIEGIKEEAFVLTAEIEQKQYCNPYYPILDLLKREIMKKKENNFADYIDEADIYHCQERIFFDFFKDNLIQRKEDVIFEELDYERKKIKDSLYNLLVKLNKEKPLVIIIKDIHNAKSSTLEFLKYLMLNKQQEKIMFIFSFQKNKHLKTDKLKNLSKKSWKSFVEKIELKETVIELKNLKYLKRDELIADEEADLSLEELIDLSNNCFNFLALKQAQEYILIAYKSYKKDKIKLNDKYYIKMINLLGDIHSLLDEADTALIYYQLLSNHLQESDSKDLAVAYRKTARVYFQKYNLETAYKLVKKSLKLALEFSADIEVFKSYFLICLIQEKWGKYNLNEWKNLYANLINYGEKLGFNNTLARCYIYYYEVAEATTKDVLNYWRKGLKIAKKYNNIFRISVAYQIRGVLYTRQKAYDKVLEYYNKSKEIRKKLNDKSSLAFIYNGLGYYRCLMGSYTQAYEYYNKSLVYSQETNDYHEIGMTCYNLALTLFLAFEHQKAQFYLEEVIEITKILEIKGLKYHSRSKIHALLGINYLKSGNLTKVYDSVAKIKAEISKNGEYKRDDFEDFFLDFFTALYYKSDSNYKMSKDFFAKASDKLNNIDTATQHIAPRFYYEYALLVKKSGDLKQAKNLFKHGLSASKSLEHDLYTSLFLKELGEAVEVKRFDFSKKNFNFKWIAESAKLKRTLNKLYNKISRVKFLNNLQNILVKSDEKEGLIKRIMELINHNFLIEKSCLYLKKGNDWENYYNNEFISDDFYSESNIKQVADICGREELICNKKDEKQSTKCFSIVGDFNSLLYLPLESENKLIGFILCLTMKNEIQFSEDDLEILSIASKQISVVLDKIDLEEKNKELTIQQDIISAVIKILELHDRYTKGHSESVASFTAEIAKRIGLKKEEVDKAYWSGLVHDIGKIMIDRDVLNKPSSLTDEEYNLIKKHPKKGCQVLETSTAKSLKSIGKYILHHHERWDGKGYPDGLRENEIPVISQILNVADAWDAMTTNRAYRDGLSKTEAISELRENKGTQFPPQVVDIALEIIEEVY